MVWSLSGAGLSHPVHVPTLLLQSSIYERESVSISKGNTPNASPNLPPPEECYTS